MILKTNHTFGIQFIFRTTKHDKSTGNVFTVLLLIKRELKFHLKNQSV